MKIKRLLEAPTLAMKNVIETADGRYMAFDVSPYRKLTEADLSPLPHYQAAGNNASEMPEYVLPLYGLEKI